MARSDFVAKIAPLIVKEGKSRGYRVYSPIIAQAVIESRYGESGLAKYHNYFGLKCGTSWKGGSVNMKTKEEYTPGTLTTIKDNFRTYSDMKAGVAGYFDFINTPRYSNLKTAATPYEYCVNIKADGYATSSSYVETLMSVINRLGLTKYDGAKHNAVNLSQVVDEVLQGKWGNGQTRKDALTMAGYDYAEIQARVNEILRG